MILPIVGYGHQVLRSKAVEIGADYPGLSELIENMFETMYNAQGVGLAAPQINLPIRLFVVDGTPMDDEEMQGFKRVFINAKKLEENGKPWGFEEGCLSIPDIREMVRRRSDITLNYFDENFEEKTETFSGMKARVIQHEYDHTEGILFMDHISHLRRSILKPRLQKIIRGDIEVEYPMKFNRKV
ncbi:MAG: peptide deformylase [Bacteroidia bacterium]|nr:peptide deformylase [Bacteroidia bacterium]